MQRPTSSLLACLTLVAVCWAHTAAQAPPIVPQPMFFEGARLIAGTGSAPIENSAFVVENRRFTRVGRRGDLQPPPGAVRVDLSGSTVIPALIDGHSHIGYMDDLTLGAQNYTRENVLDHMHRFAYFGVAASQAMGSDFGEMPYEVRDEILAGRHPDAARFFSAGRGLSPLAEISPDNMRHAAYAITTEAGARAAVRELALRKVRLIKTWVDDRGGRIEALAPHLYRAIIDEAHAQGLRVAVHATDTNVAKDLLRAGVDVFAHMISDVDDELISLFKQHPDVAVLSALGGPRRAIDTPWLSPVDPLITETVRPEQIARLQRRFPVRNAEQLSRAEQTWNRLARGISRLHAAGVKIGVGTDGGGQQGDQFIGWTMHTELENLVAAGLTPAQAIVAATRTSAEILGLDDLGTIAPGRSADFVVLDANPLDDIRNSRKISKVYLRGKEIDRERLRQSFMTTSAAQRPAP